MKLRFLPFFRRFHATNGDLGSRNFVPPTIQTARNRVSEHRRLCAEVPKLLLPTLCMALFRFGHPQENAFAFLVPLALGQIAIGLRSLDFRLPVALDDFDCFLSIRSTAVQDRFFRITRRIFAAHNFQSSGSNAALMVGSTLALSCCAVITSATEPIMKPAATSVRMVTVSPAKRAPNRTATIGVTYA